MVTITHDLLLKRHRTSASRGTVKLRVFSHMSSLSHQVEGLMSTQVTYAFCLFPSFTSKTEQFRFAKTGFPCCSWEESILPSLSTFVELSLANQLDVLGFPFCGEVKDQQRSLRRVKILQAIGGQKTQDTIRILGCVVCVFFSFPFMLIYLGTSLELTLI